MLLNEGRYLCHHVRMTRIAPVAEKHLAMGTGFPDPGAWLSDVWRSLAGEQWHTAAAPPGEFFIRF